MTTTFYQGGKAAAAAAVNNAISNSGNSNIDEQQHLPLTPPTLSSSRNEHPHDNDDVNDNGNSLRSTARIVILLLILSALILVIVDLTTSQHIQTWLQGLLEWMKLHPYSGIGVFIFVYAICTVLFVPGAILTVGCGFTFGYIFDSIVQGVFIASIAVFVGATLGSICAFLLGRYLFRDCVVSLAHSYPMFEAIDRALENNGIKIMVLLRLSPLIPYNALDYKSGVTAISFWSYTTALVGILPGVVLFTFIGATASDLAGEEKDGKHFWLHTLSVIFGLFFAALGVYVATYYANQELKKILEEQQLDEDTTCSFVAQSSPGSISSRKEEDLPEIA